MPATRWIVRLPALAASVLLTLAIVQSLADYGLPGDGAATVLAQAASADAR